MASLSFNQNDFVAPTGPRGDLPEFDFGYQSSPMQLGFYDWIYNGQGSANLIAVAGSGKSTSIVSSLLYIPEEAEVKILAFNQKIAKEMAAKIEKLKKEQTEKGVFRTFQRVSAKTFHSLGYGQVLRHVGVSFNQAEVTDSKSRDILKAKLDQMAYTMYGKFVPRLVSLAKGEGLGTSLCEATPDEFLRLVRHHDIALENESASMDEAIELAGRLLDFSSRVAIKKALLDFDDMIYLPILWDLAIWQNDFLFIDEAQDTNPCRRALARKALKPGGRMIAVGDPAQAIYGFTGASHDAMDLIKDEFDAVELPLTVSYRCPKVAGPLVQKMVPHFQVAENAPEGSILHMSVRKGVERLSQHDAVICRNTAPLIDLALDLISRGRGCIILGKDIGRGLIALIERMEATSVDDLGAKLDAYAQREINKLLKKDQDAQAEALSDRVESLKRVMGGLKEGERTVLGLIRKLEKMFSDDSGPLLTLCTGHKAKGLEWKRTAILEPQLMPSKWARQPHQYQQEKNLQYVVFTRFQEELIFLDGVDEALTGEEREARLTAFEKVLADAKAKLSAPKETTPAPAEDDGLDIPAHLRRTK